MSIIKHIWKKAQVINCNSQVLTITNKDRLCERSEPQSYPGLDKPGT